MENFYMTAIGICGDNCLYCPRYIATQSGSVRELEKVKELWVRLGLRDAATPAQSLVCYGCSPTNRCAYPELRACANEKGLENCGVCEGYPCPFIQAVYEKTEKLHSSLISACTATERECLEKAFFSKRQNLEKSHRERPWPHRPTP
jgi:hypothetical protein